MSTVQLVTKAALAAVLSLGVALPARALELKSFKDSLFAYPDVVTSEDNGDFLALDYQEMRDINGRDEIPERRVKGAYVSRLSRSDQALETVDAGGRPVDIFRAGAMANAAFAVIFIHGRGGDRRLGADDYRFGGNFNRLKNLAVDNGGVYVAPSIKAFDADGSADVAGLIGLLRQQAPQAKIVLACASMGSILCWSAARDGAVVAKLNGMMIMGGATDPDFATSALFKARLPLFFSHGAHDSVYAAPNQIALYKSLKAKDYPTRFVLFNTGSHGTPVRMTDWRDALNWSFNC